MGPVALLVDAGPLFAYVVDDEPDHEACVALFSTHPGPLAVPILVLAEVSYLLAKRFGPEPELRFLADVIVGTFVTVPVEDEDWLRIAELVASYRDLPLGTVDASIVAAAERLGIRTIATLDRRDFGAVRPAHTTAFELLP